MYQFSRAMYRQLAPEIAGGATTERTVANHEAVLRECESTIERLARDPFHYRFPARTLFRDLRPYFPVASLLRVRCVVDRYVAAADEWLTVERNRRFTLSGVGGACRALTRQGTPCQREALSLNGYCSSHQHLAETEDHELLAVG